jgi:hypothetical protein
VAVAGAEATVAGAAVEVAATRLRDLLLECGQEQHHDVGVTAERLVGVRA